MPGRAPTTTFDLFFPDLMGYAGHKPVHERFRVDRLGVQRPAPLARDFQNCRYETIHARNGALDEAEGFVEVLAQHFRARKRIGCGKLLEKFRPQSLQLCGEAHDIDERRPQIVADDVSETLNLFIGAFERRRSLGNRLLKIGIRLGKHVLGFESCGVGAKKEPQGKK